MIEHERPIESVQPTALSRLISAVFDAWANAGVHFLVLRNYEGLPQTTTNDIDVLVAKPHLALAEQVLVATAAEQDFYLVNRAEFVPVSMHFANPETTEQVHFDLFVDLRWHCFEFIRAEDFLNRKVQRGNFWVPHPADEACTNLLGNLIYKGRVREKYKRGVVAALRVHTNAARALLAESYGEKRAQTIVRLAAQEKWAELEAMAKQLRRALVLRLFTRRPVQTIRAVCADAARFFRRTLHPAGFMVIVLGPDGSGKSTIAPAILQGLTGTFYAAKSVHYHWKPKLLRRARRDAELISTDPHGKPPRNLLLSLVFFGLHWAEFVLGAVAKIYPALFRGGLVLVERYYHDFFVDQARYRLRVPKLLVRLGLVFVKKPDLVLVLDAPVETLRARKQEVSPGETERQRNAYLELAHQTPNAVVLDANQPAEQVATEAVRVVLGALAARAYRRLPAHLRKLFPETGTAPTQPQNSGQTGTTTSR
ncbi:MAG: thymidylate kinase [Verrucomicrobiae bacterium]|nr:thymidylate kinase [Verrucomicrobiae bacterium]